MVVHFSASTLGSTSSKPASAQLFSLNEVYSWYGRQFLQGSSRSSFLWICQKCLDEAERLMLKKQTAFVLKILAPGSRVAARRKGYLGQSPRAAPEGAPDSSGSTYIWAQLPQAIPKRSSGSAIATRPNGFHGRSYRGTFRRQLVKASNQNLGV